MKKKVTIAYQTPCYKFDPWWVHMFWDDHDDKKAKIVILEKNYSFEGELKSLSCDTKKVAVIKSHRSGEWYKFYWNIGEQDPFEIE